ncbi:MAG: GNAT family N-acetyltransferase [Pseudomonadota bacterium]
MIPTLTTDRLTLRAPTLADWPAYRDFYRADLTRHTGSYDDKTAWRLFASDAGHWMLHGFGWFIVDDGTGPVGACGLHHPPHQADVEIGWNTFEPALNRGYATEAATRVLAWGRGLVGPTRIVSYIDRDNGASQAVATKLGARDTGQAAAHNPACNVWEHRP